MAFWETVENLREYQNLTRKDLSSKARFSIASISTGIARGSIPSADIAVRIAKVLGVTVEYLVTGEDRHAEGPLHPEARRLLKLFATLDARDQETVMSLIESMAERYANSSGKDMSSPHAG